MKRPLLLITALFAASAAQAADLKICVEGAYPPFSYTTDSGAVEGFDIDIANALCGAMGKSCEMVKTDWDGIIPALLEKKCDAIIASMTITDDRKQVIDFSTKYYNTAARFIGAKSAALTPETLAGKVVGVQRGTTHQNFMEGEFPDVDLKLYGSQDEAYLDLTAGRLDAVMADSVAMQEGFLNTDAGAAYAFFGEAYINPLYHGDGAGIGVRQSDVELRDAFSAAIGTIRANGTYEAINGEYFDFDVFGG